VSAITFADVLACAQGKRSSVSVDQCLSDFVRTVHDLAKDKPTLRKVYSALDQELAPVTLGAFILSVLRTDPRALPAQVALVAPGAKAERRTLRLHADCYLALGEWVTDWNRRQIRRVA